MRIVNTQTQQAMTKKNDITKMNFRKFKDGDIIALMPYEQWCGIECASFMHLGQHGGADYNHVIRTTKPATESEYKELFDELTSIGYNIKVIKKKHF